MELVGLELNFSHTFHPSKFSKFPNLTHVPAQEPGLHYGTHPERGKELRSTGTGVGFSAGFVLWPALINALFHSYVSLSELRVPPTTHGLDMNINIKV